MRKVLGRDDGAGVDDRQREPEADRQQRDDDGRDDDGGAALRARQRRAHGAHLQDQRGLDAADEQEDEHGRGDGDAVLHARHARVLGREDGVRVVEGAGEVEALQHRADRAEAEAGRVEREDGRAPLVRLREQQQHDEQHEGGADLAGVVDADPDAVGCVFVNVGERDGEGAAVWEGEVDGLGEEVVDGGWVGRGHAWCVHFFLFVFLFPAVGLVGLLI